MVTTGSASNVAFGHRLLVLVLHVDVHQVVPVPPIHSEDEENEEVRGEDERFDCGHL